MLRLQKESTQFNIIRNSKIKNSTKQYIERVENEITVKLMSMLMFGPLQFVFSYLKLGWCVNTS